MEVILNDISVHDLTGTPDDARQAMNALLQVCKKAKDDLNCNGLRLPNADFFTQELVPGYTLIAWMTEPDGNRNLQTLFNGLRRFPYYEGMPEEAENEYMLSKFSLNEPEHSVRHEEEAQGLANAYLQRTLAVGFCSHDVWSKCKIGLTIQKENAGPRTIEVHHACTESCIDDEFKDWFRKAHLPPLRTHEEVDIWFPAADGYRLSDKAKDDLIYFFDQNHQGLIKRVEEFFLEIWIDPFRGTGNPEPLRYNLSGWWSRRIDDEHRLVYRFENDILYVCSCRGHYSNLSCE